jgi:hypothetical protein
MSKTITLREANQAFSRCVREVEAGEEITITRRVGRSLGSRGGKRVLTQNSGRRAGPRADEEGLASRGRAVQSRRALR